MRKPIAAAMTAVMVALGLCLVAMGIWYGLLGRGDGRAVVALTLFGGAALLLVAGLALARFAAEDYHTLYTFMVACLSVSLALQGTFFSTIWYMVGPSTYRILEAVFLILIGWGLINAGTANHFLSQPRYRAYVYDFFRSLPHAYFRYRT